MRHLCTVIISLVLASCAGEDLRVERFLVSGAVNLQQEIERVQTVFTPEERSFYVHAALEGVVEPMEVTGTWWFATKNVRIYESTVSVTPEEPVAKFFLSSSKNWIPGEYRLVVHADDRELGETSLTVR